MLKIKIKDPCESIELKVNLEENKRNNLSNYLT